MRTVFLTNACSLILACICSAGLAGEIDTPGRLDPNLVSANTEFGLKLFSKLVDRTPNDNIFISPTSIAMALQMTYNGALGETQKAMAEALELQGISLQELNEGNAALMKALENLDDDVLLDIANSLWARKEETFGEEFLKRTQDFYEADVETLDFSDPESPSVINAWVNEKTRGKIEKIVDEIPASAILYLINAVYFKGTWTIQFDEKYTKERAFTLPDGAKKNIPMMTTQSKFRLYRGDAFSGIALPYGDEKVSMYIFLPDRDSNLGEFYKKLSAGKLESWISEFRKFDLMVIMPKFKLEYEVGLNNVLTELGMGLAFSGKADFGAMCPGGGVMIDDVKHKTFVEVNEKGTEAAAVTSVRMKKGGTPPMIIDKPFLCVIRDDITGTILFMGSITNP